MEVRNWASEEEEIQFFISFLGTNKLEPTFLAYNGQVLYEDSNERVGKIYHLPTERGSYFGWVVEDSEPYSACYISQALARPSQSCKRTEVTRAGAEYVF